MLERHLKLLSKIESLLNSYHLNKQNIIDQIAALKPDAINAGTWWKDSKYLYVVYPSKGGKRKRVYIGCKTGPILTALDSIDKYRQMRRLEKLLDKYQDWLITQRMQYIITFIENTDTDHDIIATP